MARTRPAAPNLLIAFALGAGVGIVTWLDQQLIGGVDYAASIQSIEPIRGFFWNVVGAGGMACLFYVACLGLMRLDKRRWRTDPHHANHCMLHWPRNRARYRCTCDANVRNWSADRRREAFRVISGGRD